MKSRLKRPMAAVMAGAVVLVLAGGTTGAVANKLITGKDIAKNSVGTKHLKPGKVNSNHIKDGSVRPKDLRPNLRKKINDAAAGQGQPGPQGPAGIVDITAASLAAPETLANFGGSIATRGTKLPQLTVTLPAGKYLVNLSGAFEYNTDDTLDINLYPQLSLWLDANGNDEFEWQDGEGSISPNALMPGAADRHIQVNGSTVIELAAETQVKVIAHGYGDDGHSAAGGRIDVVDATLSATKMSD